MSKLESIKGKILELEAGIFQNLCNAYLSRIGYPNIVALGSQAGTNKTTPGTPDTYFPNNNDKYIFVEYTVQQDSIFNKLSDDIDKCLDEEKTHIPISSISEIICCFTSSNLKPSDYDTLIKKCNDKGISLNLIGIDKLADELYRNHKALVKEYLGISIDTEQILDMESFICSYNRGLMFAPLDTKFLFRDKELQELSDDFAKYDVVLLLGAAGTGKTRLALQFAEKHAQDNKEKLLCIKNNGQPIYEDLKIEMESPGQYFLVIDDANQLSSLQSIVDYVNRKDQGYSVKVLITVRDYALNKVVKDLLAIVDFCKVAIEPFSDDEIKKLIKENLGIINEDYLNRIVEIAEGNARIAILAGVIAKEQDTLQSINDLSQLYDCFYSPILDKDGVGVDNASLIVMGTIAFLNVIHLDHIDYVYTYLQSLGISKDQFLECIQQMHKKEIINVCNDKAVKIADQCLSNYMLKVVFFDKRLLSLSETIKVIFEKNKSKTIESINALINVFRNEELHDYVSEEIIKVWNILKAENSPLFGKYVRAFYPVNPVETLVILNDTIQGLTKTNVDYNDVDKEKQFIGTYDEDSILEILTGYSLDLDNIDAVVELIIAYYEKRYDQFYKFKYYLESKFSIRYESHYNKYQPQIKLIQALLAKSNDYQDSSVMDLFFLLAKEYLKLSYSYTTSGRKNSFLFNTIKAVPSEALYVLRKLVWETIENIIQIENYKDSCLEILNDYKTNYWDDSLDVTVFDLRYIEQIICKLERSIDQCILANEFITRFRKTQYDFVVLNKIINANPQMELYKIIVGELDDEDILDFAEKREKKKSNIYQYFNSNPDKIIDAIDLCSALKYDYSLSRGLSIAFEAISEADNYLAAVEHYIERNTPQNIGCQSIIEEVFKHADDDYIYNLITSKDFDNKLIWAFYFFCFIPEQYVNEKNYSRVLEFYGDCDLTRQKSHYLDITLFSKYNTVDENALVSITKLLFEKLKDTECYNVYFSLLFNHNAHRPKEILNLYKSDFPFIKQAFLHSLMVDRLCDDGVFFKEFYSYDNSILFEYLLEIIITYRRHSEERFNDINNCFYDFDNYIEIYKSVVQFLLDKSDYPEGKLSSFFKSILSKQQNGRDNEKKDRLIRYLIEVYSDNKVIILALFDYITQNRMTNLHEYLGVFLSKNNDYDLFEQIPLTPSSYMWSNSCIPLFDAWIEELNKVLPLLSGLQFLKHKQRVINRIEGLKEGIKREEINEMLRE